MWNYVLEVKENSIKLKDGTELPCGLVVWSTGVAPRYCCVFAESGHAYDYKNNMLCVGESKPQ